MSHIAGGKLNTAISHSNHMAVAVVGASFSSSWDAQPALTSLPFA